MAVDVLIVEKHAFIRTVLRAMLTDAAEIHSVSEIDNLEDGVTQARDHEPGVVLLGLILSASDMHTAITQLHQAAPTASIIVLGLNDDPAYKHAAITAGASNYLLKDTVPTNLATTIREAHPRASEATR